MLYVHKCVYVTHHTCYEKKKHRKSNIDFSCKFSLSKAHAYHGRPPFIIKTSILIPYLRLHVKLFTWKASLHLNEMWKIWERFTLLFSGDSIAHQYCNSSNVNIHKRTNDVVKLSRWIYHLTEKQQKTLPV